MAQIEGFRFRVTGKEIIAALIQRIEDLSDGSLEVPEWDAIKAKYRIWINLLYATDEYLLTPKEAEELHLGAPKQKT